MPVAPLATVPAGTVVKISIRLPGSGGFDGFQWVAPAPTSADQARMQIEQALLARFVRAFLPEEHNGRS